MIKNFLVFSGLFILVLYAGVSFGGSLEQPITQSATTPSSNSTLKVVPATGAPEPLDFDIQGSKPNSQETKGNLQTPQSGSQLQPNAKLKQLPEELN